MSGTSISNSSINIADQVTILGTVTVISGSGANATVTVVTLAGDTLTIKANDCLAPLTGSGAAIGQNGVAFGVGSQVTIPGDVTGVSGTGKTAVITTTTHASQTSVTHAAGTAQAPRKN